MVKLVAWDPTEGVLVLRNKSVVFADDNLNDGAGGVRFLLPILGEELSLRVPLEVQTLHFEDQNVLTKEYLRLTIRGTMRWRITDIRKFYLFVSRESRRTVDINGVGRQSESQRDDKTGNESASKTIEQLLLSAIEWLRGLTEAETRAIVLRVGSGLLLADTLAAQMPEVKAAGIFGSSEKDFSGGTNDLETALGNKVRPGVADYGIIIEDVALREIKFPEEIVEQCLEAAKNAYLPLVGQHTADVETARLRKEAEILGKDVVGTREVVGAAPKFTLPDFLSNVVQSQLKNSADGSAPPLLPAASIGKAVARKLVNDSDFHDDVATP